jgi:hypothetical protein
LSVFAGRDPVFTADGFIRFIEKPLNSAKHPIALHV